ncbi:hypothetical protein FBULB1_686 [Fusarium bulbicola]|nr:hypothetical protein FBULB1_686 [Fusarium bulbicola]
MTTNRDWQKGHEKKINDNQRNYGNNYPQHETIIARVIGSTSGRAVLHNGVPVTDRDRSNLRPNHCYKLRNKPIDDQVPPWNGPSPGIDEELHYNSFAPTGEVYKYLPCAPYDDAANILGFKKVRGVDTIMERTGPYLERAEAFAPYRLLLYRGWIKNQPALDDKHRFIYLAQSMSGDVGDCFIRLEEVHNRMRNEVTPYIQDCQKAIESRAADRRCLNFRCWAVGGRVSTSDEQKLFDKLFKFVRQNEKADHVEEFRVWAGKLIMGPEGDKLASKEFFGRYWDAVIPNQDMRILTAGIRIVVSEAYFYEKGYGTLAKKITKKVRDDIRTEVWEAIERVLETPRLKFKPTLSVQNVIFHRDVAKLPDGWNDLEVDEAEKLNNNGWRALEPHPGGLYYILVDCPVMDFLCSSARDKPLWRPGYNPPTKRYSEKLHQLLDKCGKTAPTTTYITQQSIAAAGKGKRNPTQDRCVATNAFSANVAMVTALPTIIPDPTKAKQMRIAEWLHRSAFSYGGLEEGILESSQVANNLVLGTPDTNTVMMRQANHCIPPIEKLD